MKNDIDNALVAACGGEDGNPYKPTITNLSQWSKEAIKLESLKAKIRDQYACLQKKLSNIERKAAAVGRVDLWHKGIPLCSPSRGAGGFELLVPIYGRLRAAYYYLNAHNNTTWIVYTRDITNGYYHSREEWLGGNFPSEQVAKEICLNYCLYGLAKTDQEMNISNDD